MTRKIYRTAQGKTVDLGALQLRNENVRAVGNMSVNARGDLIDSGNRPIDSRNQQVARQYRRQTTNVTDTPVRSSQATKSATVPLPPEDFQDDFAKPEPVAAPAAPAAGLAAAIARAREIRQDPLRTHQSVAEHQSTSRRP
jgi:hypothetical protein